MCFGFTKPMPLATRAECSCFNASIAGEVRSSPTCHRIGFRFAAMAAAQSLCSPHPGSAAALAMRIACCSPSTARCRKQLLTVPCPATMTSPSLSTWVAAQAALAAVRCRGQLQDPSTYTSPKDFWKTYFLPNFCLSSSSVDAVTLVPSYFIACHCV